MDNMYNYDYQFRLIVVGDSTVGKVDKYRKEINHVKINFLLFFSHHYYVAFVMEFFLKIP